MDRIFEFFETAVELNFWYIIRFLEGGKGIYFNAFEIQKLDEKNQGDHVSAHLIEVVVAHLRKKHGADVANGPSAAMSVQQVNTYDWLISKCLDFESAENKFLF